MDKLEWFEDILEPRRKEISNFMWVSRELTPQLAYKQLKKTVPDEIKLAVLNSAKIQALIEKEYARGIVSKDELLLQIKDILDEIGYKRNLQLIRWLGLFLSKMFTKVLTAIHINKISISKLRSQMGNVPVMYVPSHRSYADFILMSYICFHYDIEIPAIAAGMDFHGMWGMGSVLRNTGAFFMRRSYNDDSLYWDTFREYVHQIVVKGDLGIEFFIEGTRSRSGKSLFPKLGLLSMILKAFFSGEVPDILFVPINISYERVMEERLFGFELLGVPKPKESTSAFFKSLSLVKERYGKTYVNFGEPISAFNYFNDNIDRSIHSRRPIHMEAPTEKERELTLSLAQSIVNHQQKLAVITTFNLIAITVIDTLIHKTSALTVEKLTQEVTWLKMVIEKFGAVTNFSNTSQDILDSLIVHKNLFKVSENGDVSLIKDNIALEKVDKTKLKGYSLSEETMIKAVPFVIVQLYVNATLHYYISPAIVTIILRQIAQSNGVPKDVLFLEYSFLRFLFSREFALFPVNEPRELDDSLRILEETNVITNFDLISLKSNEKLQYLLSNLLHPFLCTYYVVSSILVNVENNECSETQVIHKTQAEIEQYLNVTTSLHPYALSLDTISNCLQSLADLKAIEKLKRNNSVVYVVKSEFLHTITTKLYNYVIHLIPSFKTVAVRAKL